MLAREDGEGRPAEEGEQRQRGKRLERGPYPAARGRVPGAVRRLLGEVGVEVALGVDSVQSFPMPPA
ncbi:MAG: hypothetical protein EXR68_02950 [Dehalococcoidia bacterium]|nr:hypothetical protein [Dehalococcoidia bacterium]